MTHSNFLLKRFAFPSLLITLGLVSLLAAPNGATNTYTEAEQASIARGAPIYKNTCSACHGIDGLGKTAIAPPLSQTDWVTGSKERLALVVAQGLYGPIEVKDEIWNQAMPPHGFFPALEGDKLDDLLNYLRVSWGNKAPTYRPGEARGYLAKYADRAEPWIIEEFEDLGLAPTQ